MMKSKGFIFTVIVIVMTLTLAITAFADEVLNVGDATNLWSDYHVLYSASAGADRISANKCWNGNPIIIGGKTYETGIVMHADAPERKTYLEIDLSSGSYNTFSAEVGIISDAGDGTKLSDGSVIFNVYTDGELVATSGVCNFGDEAKAINVSIEGKKLLRIEISPNGSHSCDWAAIGDAKLTSAKEEIDTPTDSALYIGDATNLWTDYHVLISSSTKQPLIAANKNWKDKPIIIGGQLYNSGVVMHCDAAANKTYLEIDLSTGNYSTFSAEVGVVSDAGDGTYLADGSVIFNVYTDGELVATSDVCNFGDAARSISVNVEGKKTLRMEVSPNGSHSCDWAAWGNAKLTLAEENVENPTQPPENDEPGNVETGDSAGLFIIAVIMTLCFVSILFFKRRIARANIEE